MKLVIAAVEASYAAAATGDVDQWLARTTEALVPVIGAQRGTFGYRYDARGEVERWSIGAPVVRDGDAGLAAAITSTFQAAPSSLLAGLYRSELRATTASELQGATFDELEIGEAAAYSRALGVADIVSLHAGDAEGGAIFGAATPRRRTLRHKERWGLARLASHLAAAHRLASVVASLAPVATIATDGRVLGLAPRARRDARSIPVGSRRASAPWRRSWPSRSRTSSSRTSSASPKAPSARTCTPCSESSG